MPVITNDDDDSSMLHVQGPIVSRRRERRLVYQERCTYKNSSLQELRASLTAALLEAEYDLCSTMKKGMEQGSIALIRRDILHDSYQICFSFGGKRWRRRRSMYAVVVRLIFQREMQNDLDMSCSCLEFKSSTKCEH